MWHRAKARPTKTQFVIYGANGHSPAVCPLAVVRTPAPAPAEMDAFVDRLRAARTRDALRARSLSTVSALVPEYSPWVYR